MIRASAPGKVAAHWTRAVDGAPTAGWSRRTGRPGCPCGLAPLGETEQDFPTPRGPLAESALSARAG
jgi:hypothetical protein